MGTEHQLMIQWSDHGKDVSATFKDLRRQRLFFDVILCCDNGVDRLAAHKLVLASCSSFFRRVLATTADVERPVLYLKGVSKAELEAVLNFMYRGEVRVAQNALNVFLRVAEDLEVKGLIRGGASKSSISTATSTTTNTTAGYDSENDNDASFKSSSHPNLNSPKITFSLTADGTAVFEEDEVFDEEDIMDRGGFRPNMIGARNAKRSSLCILSPQKDRSRNYNDKRRYRKEWEDDHPWLTQHRSLDKAFCLACQKPIPLKKDKIHRHSLSIAHINMLKGSSNPIGKTKALKMKMEESSAIETAIKGVEEQTSVTMEANGGESAPILIEDVSPHVMVSEADEQIKYKHEVVELQLRV